MKFVKTPIRQLAVVAAIDFPAPPSRRSVLLSSTSLSTSADVLSGRGAQERKVGMLRRYRLREQGATHTLNAGAAYWR